MNKKNLLIVLISLVLLSSCWTDDIQEEQVQEKKEFLIETKAFWEFSNEATLRKTWRLSSSQNISLNSNANGRVGSIYVNAWDNVQKWQLLAILEDNVANYNLNISSANNALSSAKNSLEVAKNNYEKAKIDVESKKITLEKQISDLRRNLNNLDVDNVNSSSSVELDKIDNSIERLEIEYENLVLSNEEQINNFEKTISREFVVLQDYLYDINYFSDQILWLTPENRNKNDSYERFLWARDSSQKIQTENLFREMLDLKEEIDSKNLTFNNTKDFNEYTDYLTNSYESIITFLRSFDTTISNSVVSDWILSQDRIDWFKSTIWGYRATYNNNKAQLISLDNRVNNFLDSYKNSEQSLQKQIENLKRDREIFLKWLDLDVESSEATLEESIRNKELTLQNLELWLKDAQNNIKDAEIRVEDARINYTQALSEAWKLRITSPISWTISNVLVDLWEQVSSWTPTFEILNEASSVINISFTKEELKYIYDWKEVYYVTDNETFTWNIYSISSTADENLKYQAKVDLPSQANLIWNIIDLQVPIQIENKLLPVNTIRINNSWVWTINYYQSGAINQMDVNVWKNYWNLIEINDQVDIETQIILNYVDNYNEEDFILKVK